MEPLSNPFLNSATEAFSRYLVPGPEAGEMEKALKAAVGHKAYPCVAAVRALRQGDYRIGAYPPMGSSEATGGLCIDLMRFLEEYGQSKSPYLSFVAGFAPRGPVTEIEFENLMWRQLELLHERDREYFSWDPRVSADPTSRNFCFSFGGHGFFVVGMHPGASRKARRFPFPALVFNLFEQFEELERTGQFEPMKQTIRKRDLEFQGSVNPMVTGSWENAEAAQYSGRNVEPGWTCPFRP
jgi:uncharacterized protein